MSAKYFSGGLHVGVGVVSGVCYEHGAAAYDPTVGLKAEQLGGCWLVSGKKILIGDTQYSVMGGFEMTNFNFHVCGTQKCCVDSYQLPGAVA
jgi:hypothetical protein